MSKLLLFLVFAASANILIFAEDSETEDSHEDHKSFDYTNPDDWSEDYPECGGSRQSPINIDAQDVELMENKTQPLEGSGYDTQPQSMTITNNGHSVQLSGVWSSGGTPSVQGGPLTGPYELAQLHFHWGADNSSGSEHTIGGKSFPLEMHMVHWKKSYQNITEALKHGDGIAVLGYLFKVDDQANDGIERMSGSFSSVLKSGDSTEIDPFPLTLLGLNEMKDGYVTYLGSLTTPPCSEAVIWLLSVKAKTVSNDQLDSFRKLQLNHNDKRNFRPPQPLNGRTISYDDQSSN